MGKQVVIAVAFCLASALVFATGTTEVASQTQEQVEIYIKAMGNAMDGVPVMVEVLNEKTLQALNATVRIEHYGWSDWQNKYRLDLVSGEPIDWLYAGTWTGYAEYANDGAFKDISDDVKSVTPDLWAAIPEYYKTALVTQTGEIYAVPALDERPLVEGALYREDLRKKHGLAPIEDFSGLEKLMAVVAENEDDMKGLGNGILASEPYLRPVPFHGVIMGYLYFDRDDPQAGLTTHLDLRDELIEWATVIRGFYDRGYFSQDVLANIDSPAVSTTDFEAGVIPITTGNSEGYSGRKVSLETANEGWEVLFLPEQMSKYGDYSHYKGAYSSVNVYPIAGDDTERALQLTELALLDEEFHSLFYFGVEGVHYEKPTDDTVALPAERAYRPNGLGLWGIMNSDFIYDIVGSPSQQYYDQVNRMVEGAIKPEHETGFILYDTSPVDSTMAALSVVDDELFTPFRVGLYSVDEIPDQVDAYLEALRQAGVEELLDYVQPYWDAYISG